jgi:hypothetical protein
LRGTTMELTRKNIFKYGSITVLIIALLIYPAQIYSIFLNLFSIVMPLILGGVLAYALNILVVRLEKHFLSKY